MRRGTFTRLIVIAVLLLLTFSIPYNILNSKKSTKCQVKSSFFDTTNTQQKKQEWQAFMKTHKPPVFTAPTSGILFTSYKDVVGQTLTSIYTLRTQGCKLPIQVWYYKTDLDAEDRKLFESMENVTTHDLDVALKQYPQYGISNKAVHDKRLYQVKGASILLSSFSQILYLDSDNIPVRDPTYLFTSKLFKSKKAIFWPDFWKTKETNPIWRILDIDCTFEYEQESAQILVDKRDENVVNGLQLAVYMQSNSDYYFKILYGDKDTFRFGFRALGVDYYMVQHHLGTVGTYVNSVFCGHTLVQYEPVEIANPCLLKEETLDCIPNEPRVMFLHLNGLKGTGRNNPDSFEYLSHYKNLFVENSNAVVFPYTGSFKEMMKNEFCTLMHSVKENPVIYSDFDSVLPGFKGLYSDALNYVDSIGR